MRCLEKIKLMQNKRTDGICKSLFGTAVLLLFLCDIKYASEALTRGMRISVLNVIPSLFPLMVASDLLSKANTKGGSYSALLFGWIFGSPICALQAKQMYLKDRISLTEYEMLCCIGTLPSIGFYLGICGNMFGSRYALTLYFTSIVSALICRCVVFRDVSIRYNSPKEVSDEQNENIICTLSSSLKHGTERSLTIISCISFFYMISSCLTKSIKNEILKAMIFGFFEFSGGCGLCASLDGEIGYVICSMILSFSGISVFMQIQGIVQDKNAKIGCGKYLLSRGVMSVLSGAISLAVVSKNGKLRVIVLIFMLSIVTLSQIINKKTLNKIKKHSIIIAKDM